MRITWLIAGAGAGEAVTADLEEAVEALQAALREVCEGLEAEVAARLLHGHWGPLRTALRTDGRRAVNLGQPWGSSYGGISVNVYP